MQRRPTSQNEADRQLPVAHGPYMMGRQNRTNDSNKSWIHQLILCHQVIEVLDRKTENTIACPCLIPVTAGTQAYSFRFAFSQIPLTF
ncbi:unnamed protein product [Heligmosomoides polygyrus]|uniref:Uncharacterized protein n=1 Tax=Heligmosomoides polygyrus TaxID=6339 RepID=A0A183FTL5_HELPZ|nr:unnamed protein product [Heligmosomoides polygyrus]